MPRLNVGDRVEFVEHCNHDGTDVFGMRGRVVSLSDGFVRVKYDENRVSLMGRPLTVGGWHPSRLKLLSEEPLSPIDAAASEYVRRELGRT